MKTLKYLYRFAVLFMWLALAFLLFGAEGTRMQVGTFVLILVALCFWILWPVFAHDDPEWEKHKAQQKALRRHHDMMAQDRNRQKWDAWWKSLGIGR